MPALSPGYKGAWVPYRNIDVDESEDQVKATPGHLGGWYIWNDSAAVIYVHFYDALAADVTVGTTTPVMTFGIPATGGANQVLENGIAFETAITVAATTAVGGTGAPAANDCVMTLFYY